MCISCSIVLYLLPGVRGDDSPSDDSRGLDGGVSSKLYDVDKFNRSITSLTLTEQIKCLNRFKEGCDKFNKYLDTSREIAGGKWETPREKYTPEEQRHVDYYPDYDFYSTHEGYDYQPATTLDDQSSKSKPR